MPTLDFAVIGAAKSGTTSLWEGMRRHPQIAVPADKERAFFNSDNQYAKGLDWFVEWVFGKARPGQRCGIVTPGLMPGSATRLAELVDRVATVPDLALVAVLRDPVDRAVSRFRQELRSGNAAPHETLEAYLERVSPTGRPWTGTDVVSVGEYGRILSAYLQRVDRERLLVLFAEDLDSRPAEVFRRLFVHLGVDPDYHAPQPRVNVGGSGRRTTDAALEELLARLDEEVFPHVEDAEVRRGFVWWLRHLWNIEPDDARKEMGVDLRRELSRHYLEDAPLLAQAVGVRPPWLPRLQVDAAR